MTFDTEVHYLGIFCKKNHEFENTRKSLRYKTNWNCVECVKERNSKWQKRNLEKVRDYKREWRIRNLEMAHKCSQNYRQKNKEKVKDCNRKYRQKNKEKIAIYWRNYYRENKKRLNKHNQELQKNQRKNDPMFRLNFNVSTAICKSLKKGKGGHWEDLVGYTIEKLIIHLKSLFNPKMDWNNYGSYWEVDHIRPICTFSFISSKDKEFRQCWALKNLRPLSAKENKKRPKDGSDLRLGV